MFFGAAECNIDQWERNLALNLRSHWQLAQYCRPYLEKSNGTIIVMTSHDFQSCVCLNPGCFPYNVAKTVLTGLVRSLVIEWGPRIRTVGLAPGFIDTPGNNEWFSSFPDPLAERKRTIRLHPVGKLGTVDEVGAFCVYLASPFASFATGSTYVIDGGRTALLQDS